MGSATWLIVKYCQGAELQAKATHCQKQSTNVEFAITYLASRLMTATVTRA